MKTIQLSIFGLLLFTSIFSCKKDEITANAGAVELEFDNIATLNNVVKQLSMVPAGSTEYAYTNGMNQKYNISLLKYFVSAIELQGPNGESFKDEVSVSASGTKGYYLINEQDPASQVVTLKNVPAGKYNKVIFTVGVDSAGVSDGAVGGALDIATSKMFWNWNSGYIAVKFEGQSEASNGGVTGAETITADNKNGMAFHVGGWKNIAGSAFVYNNKKINLTFDTDAKVDDANTPQVHMLFDVSKLFSGVNKIDFSGNHNVHKPSDGVSIADNIESAFIFDHIHQ